MKTFKIDTKTWYTVVRWDPYFVRYGLHQKVEITIVKTLKSKKDFVEYVMDTLALNFPLTVQYAALHKIRLSKAEVYRSITISDENDYTDIVKGKMPEYWNGWS